MKWLAATAVALVTAGAFTIPTTGAKCAPIVGAWYVDATGAPFAPHGAIFHDDRTMMFTNPDAAEAANSSSAGVGAWKPTRSCSVALQFLEVNADKTTHKFTTNLIVNGTVTVSGDTFTGPVNATYYDGAGVLVAGPFPAVLNGQRITVGSLPPVVG